MSNRGCSQKLQRAICDLGADVSFEQASKKMKEHYNVELCTETIRQITEKHARRAQEFNWNNKQTDIKAKQLIAESDGSMVPIVIADQGSKDRRKKKSLSWKEYRLVTVQRFGEVDWLYMVGYGSVNVVGEGLSVIGKRAGFGERTKVHCLGDGAIWVREQMERAFGCQMEFMIDFFHLCDYLSGAADIFNEKKVEWMEKVKRRLY